MKSKVQKVWRKSMMRTWAQVRNGIWFNNWWQLHLQGLSFKLVLCG